MKTYIITRFSILDESSNSWILTRENKNREELIDKLFSEERLNEKMLAFKNITYNSIINQLNNNYIWLLITSKYLPIKYKNELYSIESDRIKIIEVETMDEFSKVVKNYNYEDEYCTVRLDDDDGLNINFINIINEIYLKSKKNEIVSITNGRKVSIINNNLYIENNNTHYRTPALGLTKFNGDIYSCGNHTKLSEKYEIIYCNMSNMYFLYSSQVCDSKRKFNLSKSSLINYKDILSIGNVIDTRNGLNMEINKDRTISNSILVDYLFDNIDTSEIRFSFEIGAFSAEFSKKIKNMYPKIETYAFEANPYNFSHFSKEYDYEINGINYINMAISDSNNEIEFKVQKEINGKEINPIRGNNSIMNRIQENTKYEILKVNSISLDKFILENKINLKNTILWIDVEGANEKVLKGCEKILDFVSIIFIEVEEKKYWEDQWLEKDVYNFLTKRGFQLIARDGEYESQYNEIYIKY